MPAYLAHFLCNPCSLVVRLIIINHQSSQQSTRRQYLELTESVVFLVDFMWSTSMESYNYSDNRVNDLGLHLLPSMDTFLGLFPHFYLTHKIRFNQFPYGLPCIDIEVVLQGQTLTKMGEGLVTLQCADIFSGA